MSGTIQMGTNILVSEFRQLIYNANPIGLYVQEHQRIANDAAIALEYTLTFFWFVGD